MLRSLIFISILFMVSCISNTEKKIGSRFFPITSMDTTLDYVFFQITVPATWKKPNDDTLIALTNATATGRIQIGDNEFIWYDDGLDATDWSEYPVILPTKEEAMYLQNNLDTTYIIFNDDPRSVDSSRLKIHRIWYGQTSGYKTKFFEPFKTGYGYTGLYIDSVSEIKDVAKLNFSLHANKLDSNVHAAFVKAMQTIKYKSPE